MIKTYENIPIARINSMHYHSNSHNEDVVGDFRFGNRVASFYTFIIEICTVAASLRGNGTWKPISSNIYISLVDDSYISLESGLSGFGRVIIGNGEEYADFIFTTAGVVTLLQKSTNVVTTDTDVKFCIFDGGTSVTIKNRLGSTKVLSAQIIYNP